MDTRKLTDFFKWCTIINGGLLILFALMVMITPNVVYQMYHLVFTISRETYDVAIYAILAGYEILVMVFNLGPYLALLIINKNG